MAVLYNRLPAWIALTVWHLLQVFLFIYYYTYYANSPRFIYTRKILGSALPVARGAAGCLKINCFLIILPVCRNLISYIRVKVCDRCLRSVRRLLDFNIDFHMLCAYEIVAWTAVHAIAHCYNFQFLVSARDGALENGTLSARVTPLFLSGLGGGSCPRAGDLWVNPVCEPNTPPIVEASRFFPVWSGIALAVMLAVIVASATEFIRRSYFEVFWFTHHISLVFLSILAFHGFGGIVRAQSDASQVVHDPTLCVNANTRDWRDGPGGAKAFCSTPPEFETGMPEMWAWLLVPGLIYLAECVARFARSWQSVVVTTVASHPSGVLELRMIRGKPLSARPGQYIYLKVPKISYLEWHPFTLTSAPGDDFFSVHVRRAGDWTNQLSELMNQQNTDGSLNQAALPSVTVDGPYGTASEEWDQYDVDVLIGAGIGVTPFASILKHLHQRHVAQRSQTSNHDSEQSRLSKVYFFWICSDTRSFEWFSSLLGDLESTSSSVATGSYGNSGATDTSSFLECRLYLTRGWDKSQARNIAMATEEERDAVTGLRQKTNFGRPEWNAIFSELAESHTGRRVGVFFCGPEALSTTLFKTCNKFSSNNVEDTQFVFNKENF